MKRHYHAFDIVTPYHLISSLSFSLAHSQPGDVVTLHVVPSMHGEYLVEEKAFASQSGVAIHIVKQVTRGSYADALKGVMKKWFGKKNAEGMSAVVIGHHTYFKPSSLRCLSPLPSNVSISTFSFEEGIGSYHDLAQERKVAKREGKRFFIAKFYLKKILSMPFFIDHQWGLLKAPRHESVIQWHRQAASELANNVYPEEKVSDAKGHVLFFTSPLVQLGLFDTPDNERFILSVKAFFESLGKVLCIKPHPLDRQSYEHLVGEENVVKTNTPAEVHLMKHRYAAVAGVNSGALLTASMMFGIRAINFHGVLPANAKEQFTLGERLSALYDEFTEDSRLLSEL